MKRHRGLKRYYENLSTQVDFDKYIELKFDDPSGWPTNLHLHFDWNGYGNNRFKRREPHLDKLFRHFDLMAEKINGTPFNYNLYAVILDNESSSDALFMNHADWVNDQLGFKPESLSIVNTLKNTALKNYIDNLGGYEKLYGVAGEAFCMLYKKDSSSPF